MPVSVVVQLVSSWVSETVLEATGAMAWMSGATSCELRAAASACVSVEAEPKPPRAPVLFVLLPAEITRMFVPSALSCCRTWALAPAPSPTVRITAVMPMRMPSMVNAERSRCVRTASPAVRKVSSQLMDATIRVWRPGRAPPLVRHGAG